MLFLNDVISFPEFKTEKNQIKGLFIRHSFLKLITSVEMAFKLVLNLLPRKIINLIANAAEFKF